jgi:hypothetical protein
VRLGRCHDPGKILSPPRLPVPPSRRSGSSGSYGDLERRCNRRIAAIVRVPSVSVRFARRAGVSERHDGDTLAASVRKTESRSLASARSRSSTMLQRLNMLAVFQPPIRWMTSSATQARRSYVRRSGGGRGRVTRAGQPAGTPRPTRCRSARAGAYRRPTRETPPNERRHEHGGTLATVGSRTASTGAEICSRGANSEDVRRRSHPAPPGP